MSDITGWSGEQPCGVCSNGTVMIYHYGTPCLHQHLAGDGEGGPTQWAYDQVCKANEMKRQEIERLLTDIHMFESSEAYRILEREIERLRVHEKELRTIVLDYPHGDCDDDFQAVVNRAARRLEAEDTLAALSTEAGDE